MQPTINGQSVGYMILDTGASGFVIEKDVADRLGLMSFGELYVSGLAHKVRALDPEPCRIRGAMMDACDFQRA